MKTVHYPLIKGLKGEIKFTRPSEIITFCYAENAVKGDERVQQVIPSNIPTFAGARFIASNNTWSDKLSDGTPIPEIELKGISTN